MMLKDRFLIRLQTSNMLFVFLASRGVLSKKVRSVEKLLVEDLWLQMEQAA
jgi:hypothetical protein